jgi:hypothetical protein
MITTKAFTLTRLKKLTMWNDSDMPMLLICNNEERDKDCFLEIWHDFKDCLFLLSKIGSATWMYRMQQNWKLMVDHLEAYMESWYFAWYGVSGEVFAAFHLTWGDSRWHSKTQSQ